MLSSHQSLVTRVGADRHDERTHVLRQIDVYAHLISLIVINDLINNFGLENFQYKEVLHALINHMGEVEDIQKQFGENPWADDTR